MLPLSHRYIAKFPMVNHGISLKCTITLSLIHFKVINALFKYLAASSFAGECSSSIAKTIDTGVRNNVFLVCY